MLTNIRKSEIDEVTKVDKGTVTILYNQKPITVKPREALDVRDFGIPPNLIIAIERHILMKNPKTFSQEKTEDVYKTAKEALKKIKGLEDIITDLNKDLAATKKAHEGSGAAAVSYTHLTLPTSDLV